MTGIVIFNNVPEAIHAGYTIESPHPDSEDSSTHAAGFAIALVRVRDR